MAYEKPEDALLPRERQRREGLLGPSSCFDSITSFHDAGIRDEFRFTDSSPHQLGWDQLFTKDADIALTMMHRLEMRAAVFWRNREVRHDGRRPRALVIHLGDRELKLWGVETVYRWSRAILGPHSLGSAYLVLDNWLQEQLGNQANLAELLPRILQNNGLVATTSPIINAVAHRQNDRPSISAIAPLLAAPRLWDYDIRRHMDDRSPTHRIRGIGSGQHHLEATEEIWKRYNNRGPFHHQLLLSFHLMADQEAQAFLQERRIPPMVVMVTSFQTQAQVGHAKGQNRSGSATKHERLRSPRKHLENKLRRKSSGRVEHCRIGIGFTTETLQKAVRY